MGSEGGEVVWGCAMEDLESQIKGFGFGGSKSGGPLADALFDFLNPKRCQTGPTFPHELGSTGTVCSQAPLGLPVPIVI